MDETHVGGKEKHKRTRKKLCAGRGAVSKVATSGTKDGSTLRVSVRSESATDRETLRGLVAVAANPPIHGLYGRRDCLPGHAASVPEREACGWQICECSGAHERYRVVLGAPQAWLSRDVPSHQRISEKHIDRYLSGFVDRHNARDCDTLDQVAQIVPGLVGKRMRYCAVIAH